MRDVRDVRRTRLVVAAARWREAETERAVPDLPRHRPAPGARKRGEVGMWELIGDVFLGLIVCGALVFSVVCIIGVIENG